MIHVKRMLDIAQNTLRVSRERLDLRNTYPDKEAEQDHT
jgi:hypothetical protein